MKICRAWKKNFGGRRRSNYNGRIEGNYRTLLESLESAKAPELSILKCLIDLNFDVKLKMALHENFSQCREKKETIGR